MSVHPHLPGNPYAEHEPHTEAGGIISALDTLAYEQRTANLIAVATALYPDGSHLSTRVVDGVHAEIMRRLGIDTEATS